MVLYGVAFFFMGVGFICFRFLKRVEQFIVILFRFLINALITQFLLSSSRKSSCASNSCGSQLHGK